MIAPVAITDINVKPNDRWTKIKFNVKVGLNRTFFIFPLILKLLKIILVHRKICLEQICHSSLA